MSGSGAGAEREWDMKKYGGAGAERERSGSGAGAGGRVSGSGAVSGVTENDVSGERKFPPLPLRSHALASRTENVFTCG